MPLIRKTDFDYRPDTYWDPPDVAVANIVGDIRKACVIDAVAEGHVESLPPEYFAERLKPQQLKAYIQRGGPPCRGGELLPEYLPREVEIARVTLHPAVRAGVTIRARQAESIIRYRIVADPPGPFEWREPVSTEPLTLGELTDAIESIRVEGIERSLLAHWWTCSVEETSDVPHAIEQVKAISVFYPKLSRWYQQTALNWAVQTLSTSRDLGGELTDVDDPKVPPLHRAVLAGDREAVSTLLVAGHVVDKRLPTAALKRRSRGGFGVNAGLRERLYRLLGAEPVALMQLATPLHLAAANGHEDIVEVLLEAGGDPLLTDANGNNAADLAELNWHPELAARLETYLETQTN